jgi:hypothetical protein
MSSSVIGLSRPPAAVPVDRAAARNRSVRRRVGIVWGLLFFNTLTFVPATSALDIPSKVGKGAAQAALPLALLLVLTVNPKLKVRPNVFLCILGLLVVDTIFTAVQVHHLGTMFRTFRLAEFVAVLWLLTPWWGRSDLLLLRFHLRCLWVALGSVLLGLLIFPGHAFSYTGGRLTGVIWPMLPTQIAQYAAVVIGLTVVLWFGRVIKGRPTLFGVSLAIVILLLTHTRTALVALVAGILIAGLSLFIVSARVRRFFATGVAIVSVGVLTAAGFITAWLARGENAQGLTTLTGRTNFWALVLAEPRTKFQEIFGFGLSNASIDGLPIDSNWLSSYMQEGLFGVAVCAMLLAFLLAASLFQPNNLRRALALFIITYVLVASITEDAFTDVSTYMLHLVVAASLLI